MNLRTLQSRIDRHKGKRELLTQTRKHLQEREKEKKAEQKKLSEAIGIAKAVALKTNQTFRTRFEQLVTMALQSVFTYRNFRFTLEPVENKKSVFYQPTIWSDGNPYDPNYDMGGGVRNICSIASRICAWSMMKKRTRNTFILDEPFIWAGDLTPTAAEMLREISTKANLQIIMVTHNESLIDIGDRVYKIEHDGETSSVRKIK